MSDERIKKSTGLGREDRKMEDRAVSENREINEDERVAMFRQQFFQSSLPDLPKIDGYHTCWLTTTNPRDSLQGRIRLGYEPVKPEDVPGVNTCAQIEIGNKNKSRKSTAKRCFIPTKVA